MKPLICSKIRFLQRQGTTTTCWNALLTRPWTGVSPCWITWHLQYLLKEQFTQISRLYSILCQYRGGTKLLEVLRWTVLQFEIIQLKENWETSSNVRKENRRRRRSTLLLCSAVNRSGFIYIHKLAIAAHQLSVCSLAAIRLNMNDTALSLFLNVYTWMAPPEQRASIWCFPLLFLLCLNKRPLVVLDSAARLFTWDTPKVVLDFKMSPTRASTWRSS